LVQEQAIRRNSVFDVVFEQEQHLYSDSEHVCCTQKFAQMRAGLVEAREIVVPEMGLGKGLIFATGA
jgi:hypothetical protein